MEDFSPSEKLNRPILYKHGGVVYGGFIRDLIAGIQPTDIDVVIP